MKENKPAVWWEHKDAGIENFKQCLFGEHLLRDYPTRPLAVVEGEKTAVIASIYFPQFTWLASGGKSNLSPEKCRSLEGRKVFLFPDISAYDQWETIACNLRSKTLGIHIEVSDFLEEKADEVGVKEGYDLADYLIRYRVEDFIDSGPETEETNSMETQSSVKSAKNDAPENIYFLNEPVNEEDDDRGLISNINIPLNNPYDTSDNTFNGDMGKKEWDLHDLEDFFNSITPPDGPIQINDHTEITNPQLFINSHLQYLKANNGTRSYLLYKERLEDFREFLIRHNHNGMDLNK